MRSEETAIADAKLELPSDHLAIEEPQLHEHRGKHAQDFAPDCRFEGTNLREAQTISRLDIGNIGLSLLTINRRGHKLRALLVDMREQLLHHSVTEEMFDDEMRAAAFDTRRTYGAQIVERLWIHSVSAFKACALPNSNSPIVSIGTCKRPDDEGDAVDRTESAVTA